MMSATATTGVQVFRGRSSNGTSQGTLGTFRVVGRPAGIQRGVSHFFLICFVFVFSWQNATDEDGSSLMWVSDSPSLSLSLSHTHTITSTSQSVGWPVDAEFLCNADRKQAII